MSRFSIKKFLARAVASLLLVTFAPLSFAPHVFAAEHEGHDGQGALHVYYSESLGTDDEERVFQFRACQKVPAYVPLRCTEENKAISPAQCQNKTKKTTNEGTPIKGCTSKKPAENYPGTTIKKLLQEHVAEYDKKPDACKVADQQIVYAPMFALVTTVADEDKIHKTIPWLGKDSINPNVSHRTAVDSVRFTPEYLNKLGVPSDVVAKTFFRTSLCLPWDALADEDDNAVDITEKGGGGFSEAFNIDGVQDIGTFKSAAQDIAIGLAGAGCNNDNSGSDTSENYRSTNLNDVPAVSCSVRYRISGDSGIEIYESYVGKLYNWAAGIVGVVSVLVIVFSGIEISIAGGDTAKLDNAKSRIMRSLIGLAVLFLAALILYTINPAFFTG